MRLKRKTASTLASPDWREVERLAQEAAKIPKSNRMKWLRSQTKDYQLLTEVISKLQKKRLSTRTSRRTKVLKISNRAIPTVKTPTAIMKSLGDFEIQKILGEGNFATVYLARQISLDRQVALKVSKDTGNEGKVLALLEHDNIVRMYSESYVRDPDFKLVCMQYIPGITLRIIIEKLNKSKGVDIAGKEVLSLIDESVGTITVSNPSALRFRDLLTGLDRIDLALWTGAKLADALAHAHAKGILHLDVKPSNILFSVFGRPMLTDFNVSIDRRKSGNGASGFGGTFGYMPPEQRRVFDLVAEAREEAARRIDGRADIYSLGVVIREILALSAKTPILDERDRFIYGEINRILNRCTAADPAARFQTAAELAASLTHLIELRRILFEIPKANRFTKVVQSFPLTAISTIGAIPQMIAIAVGIFYNKTRIISHLNVSQIAWFEWLNNHFNTGISAVIVSFWVLYLYRLHKSRLKILVNSIDVNEVTRTRERILDLPYWGTVSSSLGWMISAFVYPIVLHYQGGDLSRATVLHLWISFFISWSISASYTFLLSQYCVMRFLYPRLLIGSFEIYQVTKLELSKLWSIRQVEKLTVIIPLLSVMLLFSKSGFIDAAQLESFRILILSLIAAGIMGSFFAFNIKHAVDRLYYTLTNLKQK